MIVELVLVILLLALAGRGWRNGLVEALGELVGAVIAFMVARAASPLFGVGTARLIAFVIIALLVARLVGWLFTLADKVLRIVTRLPLINMAQKFIGAILGFLSGIILVGSI
ncbi:CvpA family protein, partial [Candidatus Uhrbacteria bacterium]|nr:CvpA family protein [Candidatus Uhrbacteria bacterium]